MSETSIQQDLSQPLDDPDEGLTIRKKVRQRLLRQKQAVAAGERGEPLETVVRWLPWGEAGAMDEGTGTSSLDGCQDDSSAADR